MSIPYIVDESIENKSDLPIGEYENCTFTNCDFKEQDFSNYKFISCTFHTCNLSMIVLKKTILRDCAFIQCKMMGVQFNNCNTFGLSFRFESCLLNYASFYKLKIAKTQFMKSQLHEVDFTETDISQSVFDECDLHLAVFDNTLLEKADLRTAYHYAIHPEKNKIKKARFSLSGIAGLLHEYDIEID